LCAAFLTLADATLDRDLHESKDSQSDRPNTDDQLSDRHTAGYIDV
jgi:hypothetical protein